MNTQIFNDGTASLISNAKLDYKQKKALEQTIKGLEQMTEPEQINKIIRQMYKDKILTEFDLMELKNKGIYQENINVEQSKEDNVQEQDTNHYGDITISNDEIDDLEL